MILANRFLFARLNQIAQARANDPRYSDPNPTLVDVEKTHILFVNAHFKPFVAAAHEYQITTYGKTGMGQQVQFSIPLYGDFIYDMAVHVILGSVTAAATGPGNQLVRYVDYPGERLLSTVAFSVNGNPLDQYVSDVYPFFRDFRVTTDKLPGYKRMMGQQTEYQTKCNTQGGRASGIMEFASVASGPQTPMVTQPSLELWIPILFWYSMDVRLSLPSVAIPFGQRFLTLQLCATNQIMQNCGLTASDDNPGTNPLPADIPVNTMELYIDNIFVHPQIHDIYVKRIGFNLIRVYRFQTDTYSNPSGQTLMSSFKWPIETIYGGARPVQNTDVTQSIMLDNWYIFGNTANTQVITSEMNSNALITTGTATNSPLQASDYDAHLVNFINGAPNGLSGTAFTTYAGGATVVMNAGQINTVLGRAGLPQIPYIGAITATSTFATLAALTAALGRGKVVYYWKVTPTLDTIQLQAHGIDIFKQFPIRFYNSYLPYFYGDKVVTPKDEGKFVIFFNFYPGSYQPSGHINISRAREFYFIYTGATISMSNNVNLFLIAITINFLLISDGSAVIRYST